MAGLVGLGGVLTFVVIPFVNGLPALQSQLAATIETITRWLTEGPLQLSPQQISTIRDRLLEALNANPAGITSGALSTAATVVQSLSEILLAVFTLIFLLHGGAGIRQFLLRAAPPAVRSRVDVAGRRSLAALVAYVRATFAVAVVDAVGVGIGLFVLGIPLTVPLSALVFLAAFIIPILGAVLAGTAAVLVALVANGVAPASILLGIVVAVMQLESHVLQPLLLGRAVKLHPLAVVLAIAAGLLTAGIAGALLAVPLLAVLNSGIRSLRSKADEHLDPADVHASEPEESGPDEAGLNTEAGPKTTREQSPMATGNPRSRAYAPAHPR